MKIGIKVGVILLLLVGILLIYQNTSGSSSQALWEGYETRKMTIEETEYTLVVADTPERWQQGLMHVRKPVAYDGMVFIFPQATMQSFWNQNTFEDLTIYWMSEGEVVGESELPSIEKNKNIVTVQSPGPADTVVEIIK
ncbi:MAG: DUF192 domain-containing protein [bacterium]|nr:DUF192 domain-containing protein [bacterium]